LFSGECYFQANKKAKSEQVAQYFAELAQHCQDQGYQRLDVFLDRNTTHKAKMQQLFAQANTTLTIQVRFRLLPAYSPKLNLVEYAIHLIRQKVLHHADYKTTLSQFESDVKELCKNQKLLTKDQIMNILNHIQSLVPIPTI
jgi:DDE superfamily endonuclease